MFTYIDPKVKEQLIADGRLFCISNTGERCNIETEGHPYITIVGPIPLPLRLPNGSQTFKWYAWVRNADLSRIEKTVEEVRTHGPNQLFALLTNHMAVNSLLLHGEPHAENPLVRVHSNCLTGDVLGSMRCDCGPQLEAALEQVAANGNGAVIYMAGRTDDVHLLFPDLDQCRSPAAVRIVRHRFFDLFQPN